MKRAILCLICFFLLVPAAVHGYTAGQRVFDDAGLLLVSEARDLEELCASCAETAKADLVIVTTGDAGGKASVDYADDFYDQGGFGYDEPQGTGALFLIDMDNREIYISTCGDAIYFLTDARIDAILDAAYHKVVDGDYYGACKVFLTMTRDYMLKDPYAKPTMKERFAASARHIPLYLGISCIVALVAAAAMKGSRATRNTTNYTTYQDQGNFQLVQREDFFLRETTTQQRIHHEDRGSGGGGFGGGSSTHVSSGGVTHGGGGRKF